jgi:DNA (cytosine-5)-methyltransferase 1
MKVLNLYSCLGGNRLKWTDCEVTAIELDPVLAELYQERFPNDTVIVADAHQYLLDHYKEFDFIWSSPPCPSHSRARYWSSSNYDTATEAIYPDIKLYEEILFLQHYYRTGKYVVENVIPYYEPLIKPQERGRHFYWANFILPGKLSERKDPMAKRPKDELSILCDFHKYDFTKYTGSQKIIKIARNLVDYEAGLTIFNTARGIITASNTKQLTLL